MGYKLALLKCSRKDSTRRRKTSSKLSGGNIPPARAALKWTGGACRFARLFEKIHLLFEIRDELTGANPRMQSSSPQLGFLLGTLVPFLRASDRPIAIACLRLVTTQPLPPFPEWSVPRFSLCIAFLTRWPLCRISPWLLLQSLLFRFYSGRDRRAIHGLPYPAANWNVGIRGRRPFTERALVNESQQLERPCHGARRQNDNRLLLTGCMIDAVNHCWMEARGRGKSRHRIAFEDKNRVSIHYDQFRRPSHADREWLLTCPH
jgi:hypothetical protein